MHSTDFSFSFEGKDVHFNFPLPDDLLARKIIDQKGFYELAMLQHMREYLVPGCVVLDIGANLGNHSVFIGKYCNPSQVHAFEPHPLMHTALKHNIDVNDLGNVVQAHAVALGETNTRGVISDAAPNNAGMSQVKVASDGPIEIIQLDSLLADQLQRCDCIKLDVEGMELAVLRGATNTIKRFHPDIYVECTEDHHYRQILKFLEPLGYQSVRVFNATPTFCFQHRSSKVITRSESNFPYRLAFFAGDQGNFHFAEDIIRFFRSLGAEVHKVDSTLLDLEQLQDEMQWCDAAWFEWGNGPIIPASKLPKTCRIICRVHRCEIYGTEARSVNWNNVDDLILVSPKFVDEFKAHIEANIESMTRVHVIPNALDIEKFSYRDKPKGFEIAHITRFHPDKNPVLMLYIMQELVKRDKRYRCHVAGHIQDMVQFQYFQHMVDTLGLQENILYDGRVNDIQSWLDDKHFLLSTSVVESQGVGIMEGMAKGLKPVIHNNFGNPSCHFSEKYIFNTIDEAVEMILSDDFHPGEYRDFIEKRYALDKIHPQYQELVQSCIGPRHSISADNPFISIVIPAYNHDEFLSEAIDSALTQDYENFEVLVVDDGSTDRTGQILSGIKDPRFRWISKQHTGEPDTRNQGILQAKGEYIFWLDSDDLLFPHALSDYVDVLNQHPDADALYADTLVFDDQGHTRPAHYPDYYYDCDLVGKIIQKNLVPNPGSMVKRQLYLDLGMFNTEFSRAHDYEFWSRAVALARIKHIGKAAYRLRWHGSDISSEGLIADHSFEARVVCGLLERFDTKQLFPMLDWKREKHAYATAYALTAKIFLQWGDLTHASQFASKANEIDTRNKDAQFISTRLAAQAENSQGEKAYADEKMEAALQHFKAAMQIDGQDVEAQINLGTLYWHMGDRASCLKHMANALKLEPYNATAVSNTAMILAELGKTDDAQALCLGYLDQDPFSSDVRRVADTLRAA